MDGDEDDPLPALLTREQLLSGSVARMMAGCAPTLRLLPDAERDASLRAVLNARPERGEGAWLFAYGSLIWNPTVHHVARRAATVDGWRRSFCLSSPAGRGTPEEPGLVLALDRGGGCEGVALLLAEDTLEAELSLLWRREMLTGAYRAEWVPLRDAARHVFGSGIAFVIDPAGPQYAGGLHEAETVRRLAVASGQLGSSADYLFRTRAGLDAWGCATRWWSGWRGWSPQRGPGARRQAGERAARPGVRVVAATARRRRGRTAA